MLPGTFGQTEGWIYLERRFDRPSPFPDRETAGHYQPEKAKRSVIAPLSFVLVAGIGFEANDPLGSVGRLVAY
jgi:hypothetical protein